MGLEDAANALMLTHYRQEYERVHPICKRLSGLRRSTI